MEESEDEMELSDKIMDFVFQNNPLEYAPPSLYKDILAASLREVDFDGIAHHFWFLNSMTD